MKLAYIALFLTFIIFIKSTHIEINSIYDEDEELKKKLI
jgi:hypothetical protein